MKYGLSEAYKLVKLLEAKSSKPLNLKDLEERISDSDADIAKDFEEFEKRLSKALESLKSNDEDGLFEHIMYMRIHASGISTLFDNWIDAIDEVSTNLN